MTTATISAAKAANGPQMEEVIVKRTLGERISTATGKAKDTLVSAMNTLHLGGAGQTVKDAAKWLYDSVLKKAYRRMRNFGVVNIAGVIVTTPLRHKAWTAVKTVAKVVTYPVRLVGRAIRWGLSKFGWGRKVVAKVDEWTAKAADKVEEKVQDGLSWLDRHDNNGGMTWLRWFFQATIARKAVAMAFPGIPGWAVYAVGLMVPVYGDKKSPEEEAAIKRAKEVLNDTKRPTLRDVSANKTDKAEPKADTAQAPKGRPTPKRSEAKPKGDTVKVPVMVPSQIVLVDKNKPEPERTFEAIAFTDENGVRRIRLGSQLLHEEELPDNITVVGEHFGEVGELIQDHEARNAREAEKIEAEVRAAQATPKGRPPVIPPANRRGPRPGPHVPAKKAPAKG